VILASSSFCPELQAQNSAARAVEHGLSATASQAIKDHGQPVDENLLQHVLPLGWEHINLTGDYVWRQDRRVERGKFRTLRAFTTP